MLESMAILTRSDCWTGEEAELFPTPAMVSVSGKGNVF